MDDADLLLLDPSLTLALSPDADDGAVAALIERLNAWLDELDLLGQDAATGDRGRSSREDELADAPDADAGEQGALRAPPPGGGAGPT